MRLEGEVAIVTGAGRNIGRAIALRFAEHGADVAVIDIDGDSVQETQKKLEATGQRALGLRGDIGDADQSGRLLSRVTSELGVPTVLVNNAVQGRFSPFLEARLEDWDLQYEVGLRGYFIWSQRLARQLVAHGLPGSIISMSSIAALRANVQSAGYAAIKAGVIALTQVMATELATHGIRANAIAPGVVETDLSRSLIKTKTGWNERLARIPLGRYGTCEEIADAALFLASNESSYVTGHTLTVDGGFVPAGMMTN